MIEADLHQHEQGRLQNLKDYKILDSLPESEYDAITKMASYICDAPIALVSLIDEKRQWFKSAHGLNAKETPREWAFCAHAILGVDPFVVTDAREDKRFYDNPLVKGDPNIVFYAGIPLITEENYPLGTLCVIDTKPKKLNQKQIEALDALRGQTIKLLELHKSKILLEQACDALEIKNKDLEKFSHVAAHDLKSPLNNIHSLTELMLTTNEQSSPEDRNGMLEMISKSSAQLSKLIDGILSYSKSDQLIFENKSNIDVSLFTHNLINMMDALHEHKINVYTSVTNIYTNKNALEQIFINLISNSIKYNDKNKVHIDIHINEEKHQYTFTIKDNGPGISKENKEKVFELYKILQNSDREGNRGNGIGLATVKKLIEGLKGNIELNSTLGEGTQISFSIKK